MAIRGRSACRWFRFGVVPLLGLMPDPLVYVFGGASRYSAFALFIFRFSTFPVRQRLLSDLATSPAFIPASGAEAESLFP